MTRSIFQLLDDYSDHADRHPNRYARLVTRARRADDLGYDTYWLAEHHFSRVGTMPNPAVVLAALAIATRRIRLGPAVSVLPLRHATQVVEDYALVDALSGGRLRLGVGAGSQALEFDGFGLDYEERNAIFDERLDQLRACWASAGGRDHDSINVQPVQTAAPILVATTNDDRARTLGRAGASMMTIVTPAVADLAEIERRLAAHSEGLREGGHESSGAEAVTFVFAHVAESEEAARAAAAPGLARIVSLLSGTDVPDGEPLYDMMHERQTGVFGSIETANQTIRRFEGIGARHLAFLSGFGAIAASATGRSIELLAPKDGQ